jgi:iron complex outermembrane receptor protein/vitamin B12 transporter
VVDPLGHPIPNARIVLLEDGREIIQGRSDAEGRFELAVPAGRRFSPRVEATGFATEVLQPVTLKEGKTEDLTVALRIGPLVQQIVVSATGTATPEAQVGASVTLIDGEQIDRLDKLDLLEDLRNVPGAQILQTNQRGGLTSMFIRGGESNFNKVLVDGIPVNAIGGDFDYGQLATSGVGSVEVLRGSNSVLYGSDALGGVVNVTSPRGTTGIPEFSLSADGGNFGTLNQNASLGGKTHQFDYFSKFSVFQTEGSYPNDFFHNSTISANLGWELSPATGFRATVRHTTSDLGSPNAIDLYGISDLSTQRNESTYVGFTAQQQTTSRWHNSAQFTFSQNATLYADASPVGQMDAYGDYLGNLVTIRGANGYSVTGQAILDYGVYSGGVYPSAYSYYEARRSIYGQSDYRFSSDWTGIAGFRYEHEDGNDYGESAARNNFSSFLEANGSVAHRLFLTVGVGMEHNGVFGFAASPRASAAYYLRNPSASGFFGETKLKFNFGKGIKESSIAEQLASLYYVLAPSQIAEYHVAPTGPERSKTYDFGVEQKLWHGRALFGATFFYNDFYNIIAYLDSAALLSIGVPPGVISALPGGAFGGAYVNATSTRTLGSELEFKTDLGHGLTVQGEYAYLDAAVTKAFGSPVFNPDFPTIPIGAYSPLQGERPFGRAPHSGSFILNYSRSKLTASMSASLVGRRDYSTFLLDQYYGNTMLLPNRNLAPGYQKFDLSVGYALNRHAKVYSSIENLLSQHYQAAFGYPCLPFTIRSGVALTLGGRE